MKAVICPVCNGVGQVSAGFYNRGGDCPFWVSSRVNPEQCRSCGGKGWVEVAEDTPILNLETPNYNPDYYKGSGYEFADRCPVCGGDRSLPGGSGCPIGSHYGSYCEVN